MSAVLQTADLRKGTHMIRFAWHTGPEGKGVSLHMFPDTDISSISEGTEHMTRQNARVKWQRLLQVGFVVDRSSGFYNVQRTNNERNA